LPSAQNLRNAAPCGILELDEKGAITAANEHLCRVLGYDAPALLSMSFDDILTVSSKIFYQTHFFPLLKLHGHAEEIYLTLRQKDGAAAPMLTNATRQTDGRIICAFMLVRQRKRFEEEILSAKRRAEDALASNEELKTSRAQLERRLKELDRKLAEVEQKDQELRRLSEILSHDLREPVRKIGAFTNLIEEEEDAHLSADSRMSLSRIKAGCARISELLRTLQEFLWIDAMPETASSVDLNQVVQTARLRVLPSPEVSCQPLPAVHGFAGQLTTLFEFLFRSALARSGDGAARVEVSSSQFQENIFRKIRDKYHYADFAQIAVTDRGTAFECAECDGLFQLLRKTGEGDAHPDLAICKKIVDNHHGFISMSSTQQAGTTFKILLPMQPCEHEV
jgi:sigma-B regulation protein RsbU (phosphoserine phosphatase)